MIMLIVLLASVAVGVTFYYLMREAFDAPPAVAGTAGLVGFISCAVVLIQYGVLR